jgi:hypothetical protein
LRLWDGFCWELFALLEELFVELFGSIGSNVTVKSLKAEFRRKKSCMLI